MMPSELRIGNLFYPINRTREVHLPVHVAFKIFTIEPFKVTACLADKHFSTVEKMEVFDMKDISPITLTEEWLLKFGFSRIGKAWLKTGLENFEIYPDWNYNHCIYNRVSVKYVHQLQNLYFSLTQTELGT